MVIVRLRNMTAIDATGLKVLEDLASKLHDSGRALLFCGALSQPRQLMQQAEFDRHVGAENICPNIEAALQAGGGMHARNAGGGELSVRSSAAKGRG